MRILTEKRQGQWVERTVTLLPGYVFVYARRELPIRQKAKARHLYKVLEYAGGLSRLEGEDEAYALWVHRHQGQIRPSRLLAVGDQVTVVEGPLKDCAGQIIRLDRHKRRVWVEFTFDGQKRSVSLSAEWVDQPAETKKEPEETRQENQAEN